MDTDNWEQKQNGIGLSYVGYQRLYDLFVQAGCTNLESIALVSCVALGDEEQTHRASGGRLDAIVEHARHCGKVPK